VQDETAGFSVWRCWVQSYRFAAQIQSIKIGGTHAGRPDGACLAQSSTWEHGRKLLVRGHLLRYGV